MKERPLLLPIIIFAAMMLAAPLHAIDLGVDFTRKMNEGIAAYESGEFDAAQLAFQDALLMRPQSIEAKMNLGLARARLGQPLEATMTFSEIVEMSPANRERLAQAYYNRGRSQYDAAQAALEAEEPDPRQALAHALDSLRSFDQATSVQPQMNQALYNRAQAQHLVERIARQMQMQQQQQQRSEGREGDDPHESDMSGEQSASEDQQRDSDESDPGGQQEQQDQPPQPDPGDSQQDSDQQQPGEDDPADEQTARPNESTQQDEQSSSEQQQGRPDGSQDDSESQQQSPQDGDQTEMGMSEVEPRDGMSPEEARNLLNILGNQQILRFRTPNRGERDKTW